MINKLKRYPGDSIDDGELVSFKFTKQELRDLIMALGIAYENIGKNNYGTKDRYGKLRIYLECIFKKNIKQNRRFAKLRSKLYELFYPND